MLCVKTIKKLPLAAVGLIDLAACSAEKAICSLAKRGENAVKRMKQKENKHAHCCDCSSGSVSEHS